MCVCFLIARRLALLFFFLCKDQAESSRKIADIVRLEGLVKVNFAWHVKLVRDVDGEVEALNHYFHEPHPTLFTDPYEQIIIDKLDEIVNYHQKQIGNWVHQGSVDGILDVYLDFARYLPLRGGTYMPLPKKLAAKKSNHKQKKKKKQGQRVLALGA